MNLAEQAANAGVRRFLYVSSIGVNGSITKRRPFCETDPVNPGSPYAVSKWEAEQGLTELHEKGRIEVTIVRPPLVYGPGAPRWGGRGEEGQTWEGSGELREGEVRRARRGRARQGEDAEAGRASRGDRGGSSKGGGGEVTCSCASLTAWRSGNSSAEVWRSCAAASPRI